MKKTVLILVFLFMAILSYSAIFTVPSDFNRRQSVCINGEWDYLLDPFANEYNFSAGVNGRLVCYTTSTAVCGSQGIGSKVPFNFLTGPTTFQWTLAMDSRNRHGKFT